jgi:hypothetical protein
MGKWYFAVIYWNDKRKEHNIRASVSIYHGREEHCYEEKQMVVGNHTALSPESR